MGFFCKIWKGIKTGVKSIGEKVKKAAKSVGKFMNKIGVAGQIGMMFLLPGIGGMLSKGIGVMAGASNPIIAGMGKVLQTAGKFASTAGNAFRTVTDGVMSFVGEMGKGFVNQTAKMVGIDKPIFSSGAANMSDGFTKWMNGVADDAANIMSPFREPAKAVASQVDEQFLSTFDSETYTNFSPSQKEFRFYEVAPNQFEAIKNAEITNNGGFISALKQNIKEAPTTLLNKGMEAATSAVVTKGMEAVGLSSQPTYNQVSNTNVIPKFDSAPISNVYQSNGVNYGALPDNRIQFLAAQQLPFGDFGMSSFNQFKRFGIA